MSTAAKTTVELPAAPPAGAPKVPTARWLIGSRGPSALADILGLLAAVWSAGWLASSSYLAVNLAVAVAIAAWLGPRAVLDLVSVRTLPFHPRLALVALDVARAVVLAVLVTRSSLTWLLSLSLVVGVITAVRRLTVAALDVVAAPHDPTAVRLARRLVEFLALALGAVVWALLAAGHDWLVPDQTGTITGVGRLGFAVAALSGVVAAVLVLTWSPSGVLPAATDSAPSEPGAAPSEPGAAPSEPGAVPGEPKASPGLGWPPAAVVATLVVVGVVAGLGAVGVQERGGGAASLGLLLLALLLGTIGGWRAGRGLLPGLPPSRLAGLAVVIAGVASFLLALVPDLAVHLVLAAVAAAAAGTLTGDWAVRSARVSPLPWVRPLAVTAAVLAGVVAGSVGAHEIRLGGGHDGWVTGAAVVHLVVGLVVAGLGLVELGAAGGLAGAGTATAAAWRRRRTLLRGGPASPSATGFFIALEGGDGAGKSTQAALLEPWLAQLGHDVVLTREPGATVTGAQLREVLLTRSGSLTAQAEALLFAADRAQHVSEIVRPALERGALVIGDRYSDSSVAYQGAGRELEPDDVARLSRWATQGLLPTLTVLLDVPPSVGRRRREAEDDRLEAEPDEFHARVRQHFLDLAAAEPDRYVVIDAAGTPQEVQQRLREQLSERLPLSAKQVREREEARLAAQERARREAEELARREAEEQARRQAEELARREAEEQARRQAEEQARRQAEEQAAREAEERDRLAAQQAERDAQTQAIDTPAKRDDGSSRPATRPSAPDPATGPPTKPLDLGEELFGLGDDEPR